MVFNIVKKLIWLLLFVTTLYAQSNLKLEFSQAKQNAENGIITMRITNESNEALKILTWNTPLEKTISADLFQIQNGKNTSQYLGRMVKRGTPTEADYTRLNAGETRTVFIELAKYYQMEVKGNYAITYKGFFETLSKNAKEKESSTLYKVGNPSINIFFSPPQKKTVRSTANKVNPSFTSCSTSERNILNTAHNAAIMIARNASQTMNSASANTTGERYNVWFGAPSNTRQSTVKTHLNNIYSALDTQNVSFDCTCTESAYAYVYPSEPHKIYLCNAFWSAPVTGTDSQAGTLVHEVSHFTIVANTDDYAYGHSAAKSLAVSDPAKAIFNADNHEYFAENTPYLSMASAFDDATHINHILKDLPLSESIDTPREKDLYKFVAPYTALYTFYTTDTLDTYGTLFSANYNLLIHDDDSGVSRNFKFSYNLVEGKTYYLEVRAYYTYVGGYTLQSSAQYNIVLIPMGDGLVIPVPFVQ